MYGLIKNKAVNMCSKVNGLFVISNIALFVKEGWYHVGNYALKVQDSLRRRVCSSVFLRVHNMNTALNDAK